MHPFDARIAYGELCRPLNARSLAALRLDVIYERALGDQLVYRDERGREIAVTDFVGGYGATLLGHHHPVIAKAARDAIDDQLPFAAQGSIRGKAAELAARLHEVMLDRSGWPYAVLLASTGTEAVELALKHAELRWRKRIDALRAKLERAIEQALRSGLPIDDELAPSLRARFESNVLRAAPIFVALERGFHGKTIGSLSLTFADAYRAPFARLLMPAWFVPIDDPAALERVVETHMLSYAWPVVGRDAITIETRQVCGVVAMIAEPIQGEGGVRPVPPELLARARSLADEHEISFVLDEIQCGMGRTGTFLYSEQLGVRGDVVLLSKSLGGGLAKISACLIRKDHFDEELPMVHGSTFAEDDPSAAVALASLGVLLDGVVSPMDRARRIGARLVQGLTTIARRYPDVVRDVRGVGLMIGVELGDRVPDGAIRALYDQDLLGYAVAGHLLHEHHIRVMPCMSAPRVLRLEPSAFIAEIAIERLLRALRDTCAILAAGDAHALLRYIVGRKGEALAPITPRSLRPIERADVRAGFVGYFVDAEQMPKLEPSFARFTIADREALVRRAWERIGPSRAGSVVVRSANGASVELRYYGLFIDSRTFFENLRGPRREVLRAQVEEAAQLAKADGCTVIGFGGLTSVVTGNCRELAIDGVALTTGNSLTVAMCLDAARANAAEMGIMLAGVTGAVVGAGGNIGSVYAARIADEVARLVLIGRAGHESSLVPLARRIYERAYERLFTASDDGGIEDDAPLRTGLSRSMFRHPIVRSMLDRRERPDGAKLEALFADVPLVSISSDPRALRDASLVLGASNSPAALIHPEHLGEGPVLIVDVAVPGDAHPSIATLAPRVKVITGGAVDLGPANVHIVPHAPIPNGHLYACATETIVLALEGRTESFSVGALRLEQVDEIRALAGKHGFTVAHGDHTSALDPLRRIA
jgi:acetylornithine/succinyldiaminopimelate/putrescine aminotransferase/predicted amino acid dehydrogenase